MENVSEILGIIIVLLPVFIFVLTMLVIKKRLIEKADLTSYLSEPDDNNEGKNKDATPVKKSASRLILFLSGVTSLILGVCITTYYFYMTIYCIDCSSNLDLTDFTNVILALGIGVVPYAVNQVKKIKL